MQQKALGGFAFKQNDCFGFNSYLNQSQRHTSGCCCFIFQLASPKQGLRKTLTCRKNPHERVS